MEIAAYSPFKSTTVETPNIILDNEQLKLANTHKILMTSMNENRSVNETGKYTGMVKQKTKNDLAQGGADYESLYESLTGHKSKQEKSVFHGMLYLMSFLLVLVFLTAVASLALSLTRFKMSPGMFPRMSTGHVALVESEIIL